MKKSLLLSLVLLLSCAAANSSDWRLVDTKLDTVRMYIDMDSIKVSDDQKEYLYAARYSVKGAPEKIVYLKTDTDTEKLGIIRVDDFTEGSYRPIRNLTNPHVFMKNSEDQSFLKPLHECILAISRNQAVADGANGMYVVAQSEQAPQYKEQSLVYYEDINGNTDYIREEFVSYTGDPNNNAPNDAIKAYLISACELINSNWLPPVVEHNARTIINASINKKGKIVSYVIKESSGDELLDKSAVDAIYKSQPYKKLPAKEDVYSMTFKFVFERAPLGKSVVY